MVVGSELMLSPAPTTLVYPDDLLGEQTPTSDGRLIVQQPSRDARVREWHWSNFPAYMLTYDRQYRLLESLRSRFRQEAGAGSTPYIYVKDSDSRRLGRRIQAVYTVNASGNTTTTCVVPIAGITANQFINGTLEILGTAAGGTGTGAYQMRPIVSNTATTGGNVTFTITPAWGTIPNGARILVSYYSFDFYRARLIDVGRKVDERSGNVRYSDTWFKFTIEDPNWNGF